MVVRGIKNVGPVRLRAEVIKGFGRGAKELGFPTANMRIPWGADVSALHQFERQILDFAQNCETGVYFGWAQVEGGIDDGVYKCVASVGYNPHYGDLSQKTIEPWIMHDYKEDFYGANLRVVICARIRSEEKFNGLEELIEAIRDDCKFSDVSLDMPEFAQYKDDGSFVKRE